MANWRRISFGAVVAAALVVPPVIGVGAAPSQASCTQPYAPLADGHGFSGDEEGFPEPALPGDDLALGLDAAFDPGPLDMDGDGTPDDGPSPNEYNEPITVTRGDGVLTVDVAAPRLGSSAGDLDGDGRDELLVLTANSSFSAFRTWIIPGTTPTGTHPIADIGIEIDSGIAHLLPDRDGDGNPELVVGQTATGEVGQIIGDGRVLSGAAVMAVGAPGDARGIGSLFDLVGEAVGYADLGDGPLTVISADDAGAYLNDEAGHTDFAFGEEKLPPGRLAVASVPSSDAGTFLRLKKNDRSGLIYIIWRIDDPCGPLPPGLSVPTTSTPAVQPAATGAEPIPGSAGFTG